MLASHLERSVARQAWKAVGGARGVRVGVDVDRGAVVMRESQRTSTSILFDVLLAPGRAVCPASHREWPLRWTDAVADTALVYYIDGYNRS
jgi:hypothetical protein